jgi:hypothetical protein
MLKKVMSLQLKPDGGDTVPAVGTTSPELIPLCLLRQEHGKRISSDSIVVEVR